MHAAGDTKSSRARAALESLANAYWYPLYAFARRIGNSPEDAADLTQGFFGRVIESNSLMAANREHGRFRSFLLTAFKHFMADEWKSARRQKRGGATELLSIDAQFGEERYRFEPADRFDAEQLFQRRWAMTIIDQSLARLESELREVGRAHVFELLHGFLVGERSAATYADAARQLKTSEAAIKMTVSRLRQRVRELIREEVAQTVSTPAEIDEEYRALVQAMRS